MTPTTQSEDKSMGFSSTNPQDSSSLVSTISEIVEYSERLDEDFQSHFDKIRELRERLEEQCFHLAILGQFKRGKSTLLNALIGETLLPTAVVPLTAIPTFLYPGSSRKINISYKDNSSENSFTPDDSEDLKTILAKYVTEEGNPNNQRQVDSVEINHQSPLLQEGVVLIDTPGIGSTFRHNTETTLNFLPQCDAALFLVSADPPLTEVEVEFLKEVRSKVPHLVFILNKVDYLNTDEQESALKFLKSTLKDEVGLENPEPIFDLSAKQGLEAQQNGDDALWEQSGVQALQDHLLRFLVNDKKEVLQTAVADRIDQILSKILMQLRTRVRSLQMPLKDLDRRKEIFEEKIKEAKQEQQTAQDLLASDHERLKDSLEEQAEELHQRTKEELDQVVHQALEEVDKDISEEKIAQDALEETIPGLFERELGKTSRQFKQKVTETLEPHQERANSLVESVRENAAELLDIDYQPIDSSDAFSLEHKPYWVSHKWRTSINPITPSMIDHLLPHSIRKRRRLRRIDDQVETLVTRNVENLRWSTLQNLNDAVRQFRSTLDSRLQEVIDSTKGAIQAARTQHQKHSETISEQVNDLRSRIDQLEQLQDQLRQRRKVE